MEIPFNSIKGIHYYHPSQDEHYSMFAIELIKPPIFKTRRLHCSASLKNEFKIRSDFTNGQASTFSRIFFTGEQEDFADFFSILFSLDDGFKAKLDQGIQDIGDDTVQYSKDQESKQEIEEPKTERKISEEILELLVKNQILQNTSDPLEKISSDCFRDYIKHVCNSSQELQEKLDTLVECTCEKTLPLSQMIKTGCPLESEKCLTFYSFCNKDITESEKNFHCNVCHNCFDNAYWHCKNCNKCSFGKSIGHCQWCGSAGNENIEVGKVTKTKPFPLSLHIKNLLTDNEEESEPFTSDVDSETDQPEWIGWTSTELTSEFLNPENFDMPYMMDVPPGFENMNEEVMMQAFANAMSGMGSEMFGEDEDDDYQEDEENEQFNQNFEDSDEEPEVRRSYRKQNQYNNVQPGCPQM